MRRHDVHGAARVRERRALGRPLGRADHRALLGHRGVVHDVRGAVGVARDDLVELGVPQQGHDLDKVRVRLRVRVRVRVRLRVRVRVRVRAKVRVRVRVRVRPVRVLT